MKIGSIVKVSDSWNSSKPPEVGILLETVDDLTGFFSREKIKVLLPNGKTEWRFSFEIVEVLG